MGRRQRTCWMWPAWRGGKSRPRRARGVAAAPPRRPPHPGPRALHLSTVRRNPVTHTAQLVIVGGYTGDVLQSLAPWALDLEAEGDDGDGGHATPPRWHPSPAAAAEVEAAVAQHTGAPPPFPHLARETPPGPPPPASARRRGASATAGSSSRAGPPRRAASWRMCSACTFPP